MKLTSLAYLALGAAVVGGAAVAQPAGPSVSAPPESTAPDVGAHAEPAAAATTLVVTNGPIPDTPANRAKYGEPLSHAGRMSKAAGN